MRSACRPAVPAATLALLFALHAPSPASAADEEPGARTAEAAEIELDSGRRLLLFPSAHLYRPYRADPHAPASAIQFAGFTSTGIPEGGDLRWHLRFGGRFGLLRLTSSPDGGRSWQLNLDVGLDAQFDLDNGLDNTGWDGNYGLSLSTRRRGGRVAWNVGLLHTSAHLGDEWIQRTGRERINYTREEVRAGLRWRPAPRWSLYAEGAWGHVLRNEELMEPARAQVGCEWEAPGSAWGGLAGWYLAADLSSWEERDWRVDWAVQWGVAVPTAGRVWRFGVEYVDGRVPLGEFFQETEGALAVGLWAEL